MKKINFKDLTLQEVEEVNRALYAAIQLLNSRDYINIDFALEPALDNLREEYSRSLQALKEKKPIKLSRETISVDVDPEAIKLGHY